MNLSVRSAIGFQPKHRLVYSASVGAPTLTRARSSGAISLGISRLYWLCQPKEGLSFIVGRDSLPSGLGFARRTTNPNVTSTPSRLTSKIKLSFDMLDVYAPSTSRAFAFSVQVKAQ